MSLWKNPGRPVILASQSPRRKQILYQLGLTFDIIRPRVPNEEDYIDTTDLEVSLERLAEAKAGSVSASNRKALVLGADTVVAYDDNVIGKPKDNQDAERMLLELQGREHYVYSGIALKCEECDFIYTSTAKTKVFFRSISSEEIREYLAEEHYIDKAGAYAIQGKAMAFVDRIEGCFYNVMGLPVTATINLFQEFIMRKGCSNV